MRQVALSLTAALVLTCISCAGKNRIYPVSGKVTWDGSPASGATVFLQRTGGDSMNDPLVMGVVQEDGAFELVCGARGKGAPPGEYDVLIEWKRVTAQSKGGPRQGPDQLGGRYADPNSPRFHVVVKAERNVLPPFELKE
jgi:hypothetical protein